MSVKRFAYTDIDGDHFPDTTLGSDLYYGLDFTCWLESEEDTIVSATWYVPDGIESDDDFLQGKVGTIKLRPTRAGSYVINCELVSEETVNEVTLQQTKSIDTVLKCF
jgi:hypothetical protein